MKHTLRTIDSGRELLFARSPTMNSRADFPKNRYDYELQWRRDGRNG